MTKNAFLIFRKDCKANYGDESPIRKGCRFYVAGESVPIHLEINKVIEVGTAKIYKDGASNMYATYSINAKYECLLSKLILATAVYPVICIKYDTTVLLPKYATVYAIRLCDDNVDKKIPKLTDKHLTYEKDAQTH